jgi:hypothetical protein
MRTSKLALNDLVSRGTTGREVSRMMNVKLPVPLLERIGGLAAKLRASKTELVIAILNEGLDSADKELKGWKAPPKPVIPKERRCSVAGCERERVAKGVCVTHYQAQRRAKVRS